MTEFVANHSKKLRLESAGDAMSHFSKGVVGMRSPYSTLLHALTPDVATSWRKDHEYKGGDVRGVSLGGGTERDVTKEVFDKSVKLEGLYSLEGKIHEFVGQPQEPPPPPQVQDLPYLKNLKG